MNTTLRLDDWHVRTVLLVLKISQADAARAFSRTGKKQGFSRFGTGAMVRARVMNGLRHLAPAGTKLSYPRIAELCGMRTHVAVLEACRRPNVLSENEKKLLAVSGEHAVAVVRLVGT